MLLKDTLYRAAVFLFYYGHCFLSLYRTAILQPLCIELLAGTASGFSVILLRFFVGFFWFCFVFAFFPGEYPQAISSDGRNVFLLKVLEILLFFFL